MLDHFLFHAEIGEHPVNMLFSDGHSLFVFLLGWHVLTHFHVEFDLRFGSGGTDGNLVARLGEELKRPAAQAAVSDPLRGLR